MLESLINRLHNRTDDICVTFYGINHSATKFSYLSLCQLLIFIISRQRENFAAEGKLITGDLCACVYGKCCCVFDEGRAGGVGCFCLGLNGASFRREFRGGRCTFAECQCSGLRRKLFWRWIALGAPLFVPTTPLRFFTFTICINRRSPTLTKFWRTIFLTLKKPLCFEPLFFFCRKYIFF